MAKLTHKQKLFIDSLVLDKQNLPNAYKVAFSRPDMTPKQASNAAGDLMKKQHVAEAVEELQNRLNQAVVDKHAEATLGDVEERRAFVWNSLKNIVIKATAENNFEEARAAAKLIGEMGGCAQFMPAVAIPASASNVTNIQLHNQAGGAAAGSEREPCPLDAYHAAMKQMEAELGPRPKEEPKPIEIVDVTAIPVDVPAEAVIEAGA